MHFGKGYKDYWRFTPYAIEEMFKKEGMEVVYMSVNSGRRASTYVFAIASKKTREMEGSIA